LPTTVACVAQRRLDADQAIVGDRSGDQQVRPAQVFEIDRQAKLADVADPM
jgi:hypothetical protein